MGSKTPLYDKHVEAGARIVDFGGWDMPLHYGSQKEEHHAVRRNAGIFDVSHMTIVDLSGERVRSFLQYLVANDVAKLKDHGKALYTCMLNPDGGVIDAVRSVYEPLFGEIEVVEAAVRIDGIDIEVLLGRTFLEELRGELGSDVAGSGGDDDGDASDE